MPQEKLSLFDKFGKIMSSLDTYFLEMSDNAILKIATKSSCRGKKYRNLTFLGYFSDAKTKDCYQKDCSVYTRFGTTIPCSDSRFLGVDACLSLKVASKVF